jgi:hypothetical protein
MEYGIWDDGAFAGFILSFPGNWQHHISCLYLDKYRYVHDSLSLLGLVLQHKIF